MNIEKRLRTDTPQVGVTPYRQIHAHSTGNSRSTLQNEVDNQVNNRPVAFATHFVGNGRVVQTAPANRGAYDVGGGWNYETYAAVELIESHKTKAEFDIDYRLYVNLLRQLADEAKIPKTLDTSDLAGIKTHMYCTYNQPNNGSDHIDPYPYLNKWGITVSQFGKDLTNGFSNSGNNQNTKIELGEFGMFIYWQPQAKGTVSDAFGVWGNKRFYINNTAKLKHFKNIVKNDTGKECREYRFNRGSEEIKTIESFTELQKTMI